ncbi:MAG: hypothetical protein RBR15_13620 [Sphaerochaeta sp.]|nr:hypothetical protein [Sphaerochaeta sp.]
MKQQHCIILLALLLLTSPLVLFAKDMVTLRDGTIVSGEVSSYATLGRVTIQKDDGTIVSFSSRELLSIEKSGIESRSLPADPYIHFHTGINKVFVYVPPRYTYRGRSYNMETGWGMDSDIGEFFAYLREQHPTLDERTLALIGELEKKQKNQNISMMTAGLCIGVGTVMTFLPLNLDDIGATPSWALGVSLGGLSLNVVGLGVMLVNAFISQSEYPPLIADSFNAYSAKEQKPYQ